MNNLFFVVSLKWSINAFVCVFQLIICIFILLYFISLPVPFFTLFGRKMGFPVSNDPLPDYSILNLHISIQYWAAICYWDWKTKLCFWWLSFCAISFWEYPILCFIFCVAKPDEAGCLFRWWFFHLFIHLEQELACILYTTILHKFLLVKDPFTIKQDDRNYSCEPKTS